MLDSNIIRKVEEFVYAKPRTVDEIAKHINKNWRTANRYVDEIKGEFGTLDTRVFREGTRGALKLVYWASMEKVSSSVFQENLEQDIFKGKHKEDFSAFDIFQYVESTKKEAWVKEGKNEIEAGRLKEFKDILLIAKKQILFFSGNLSFVNYNDGKTDVFSVLEELVRRGISIKVLCRVDLSGKENVTKLLSLNHKYGKQLIEIRDREQPVRAVIIDDKLINIKEIKEPTGKEKELSRKLYVFYTIRDKDWIEWLTKIFWKMFNSSISSEKRLEELKKIRFW